MSSSPTESSSNLPAHLAGYANELAAAQKRLDASAGGLAALLDLIIQKPTTRDQLCDLLEKSWRHLQTLRELLQTLGGAKTDNAELIDALTVAHKAIDTDASLSLTKLKDALDAAGNYSKEVSGDTTIPSLLTEAKALACCLERNYDGAAGHYQSAAVLSEQDKDKDAQWRYKSLQAAALCDLGRESLDDHRLSDAVALFEAIASELTNETDDPDKWAKTQSELGNALGISGQRQRGTHQLQQAVAGYRKALKVQSPEHSPAEWAATQNSLGNALGILAHRQKDVELLEQSQQAFEQALTVRTQAQHPWDWAATQNNLGSVLQALGQQKNDPQLLKRAVEAYKQVLLAWTRDQAPLHWATTFNNLGTALRLLGEKRKGPRTLEQAVAAYRNALAERTRERVPAQWAMTQNNLGTALQKLGERSESPQPFKDAILAYQSALKEWTQERSPMTWALTAANLAVAQKSLAERLGDAGTAGLALSQLEAVAKVFREASHAPYYEHATEQIAKTRELLEALGAH